MATSTVSINISQPVETVWQLLVDPENLKHWLTGFKSLEVISGKAGEAGSVSKMKVMEGGKEMEVTETTLAVNPPQQYSFSIEHKLFKNIVDIHLKPAGNGTVMSQTVQFFPRAFFLKIMMVMMKGQMKKRTLNDLLKFKAFAESKIYQGV
jgi:carbon monoxide dehydrogenase subunit G